MNKIPKGKNKKRNSDPFLIGAIKTIKSDSNIWVVKTVQVDLKSIFDNNDFFIVGKIDINVNDNKNNIGVKYFNDAYS